LQPPLPPLLPPPPATTNCRRRCCIVLALPAGAGQRFLWARLHLRGRLPGKAAACRQRAALITWSAAFFSPLPIQRPAASAAASVTLTSSSARLRCTPL
jgi:hypothetical protein